MLFFSNCDRHKMKDVLDEAIATMSAIGALGQESCDLHARLVHFTKTIIPEDDEDVPKVTSANGSDVMLRWREADRIITSLDDLHVYYQCYQNTIDSTRHEERRIINDDSTVKYVTSAYIKRLHKGRADHLQAKRSRLDSKDFNYVFVHERSPLRDREDLVENDWLTDEMMAEEIEMKKLPQNKAESPVANIEKGAEMAQKRAPPEVGDEDDMEVIAMSTLEKTNRFLITGVFDPQTGGEMEMSDAISAGIMDQALGLYVNPETKESMPITEAMDRGLIQAEMVNSFVEEIIAEPVYVPKKSVLRLSDFFITGAMDTQRDIPVSVTEALNLGIINKRKASFCNLRTGCVVPIKDAVSEGLVEVEGDISPYDIPVDVGDEGLRTFRVESVVDPVSGARLQLDEAVEHGIINLESGMFLGPAQEGAIPLIEAIRRDYIVATKVMRTTDRSEETLGAMARETLNRIQDLLTDDGSEMLPEVALKNEHMHRAMENVIISQDHHAGSPEDMIQPTKIDKSQSVAPVPRNIAPDDFETQATSLSDAPIHEIIPQDADVYRSTPRFQENDGVAQDEDVVSVPRGPFRSTDYVIDSVNDRSTGSKVPLETAIESTLYQPDEMVYTDLTTDEKIPLLEAIENDLVDGRPIRTQTYEVLCVVDPSSQEEISLDEAAERQMVDMESGHYQFPPEWQKMSVSKAIAAGLVKAVPIQNPVFAIKAVYNPTQDQKSSDIEAVEEGLIDLERGVYLDPLKQESTPLYDAVQSGLIEVIPLQITSVLDPERKEKLSLEEAVERRILNLTKYHFVDPRNDVCLPLMKAIDEGYITAVLISNPVDCIAEVLIPGSERPLSVTEALAAGVLDRQNSEFIHPDTHERIPVEKGIESGILTTLPLHIVAVHDPLTNENVSLNEAVARGIVDVAAACYVSPISGDSVPLFAALDGGIIEADQVKNPIMCIKSVKDPKTGEELPLQEAMDKGLYDVSEGVIVTPDTKAKIPLKRAIRDGYVKTVPCYVEKVVDPKTQEEIPFEEAVRNGYIDIGRSCYNDVNTGNRIPLVDAVQHESVVAKLICNPIAIVEGVVDRRTGRMVNLPVSSEEGLYDIPAAVYHDPVNGNTISLPEAVHEGLVKLTYVYIIHVIERSKQKTLSLEEACYEGVLDVIKSVYYDTKEDETLSITGAIKAGFVKVVPLRNPLSCPVSAIDTQHEVILSIEESEEKDILNFDRDVFLDTKTNETITVLGAVDEKLVATVPIYVDAVVQPSTAKEMKLEEAGVEGILDLPRFLYIDQDTKETYSFDKAIEKELIKATRVKNPVFVADKAYDPIIDKYIDFDEAISKGILDSDCGAYVDPASEKTTPLHQAIVEGQVTTVPFYIERVIDMETAKEISFEEAAFKGLIDLQQGSYNDYGASQKLPLCQAIEQGLVKAIPLRNPVYSIESVTDTTTGELVPIQEAVGAELVNLSEGVYTDPETNTIYPLHYAVEHGFAKARAVYIEGVVHPQSTNTLIDLKEACQQGMIDIPSSVYIDPRSNQPIPLSKAIEEGHVKAHPICSAILQPVSVYDPATGSCVPLEEASSLGLFDRDRSVYIDPESGEHITLSHATDRGLVKTKPFSVKSVFDNNTGEELTFAEALQREIIDLQKSVYFDTKKGTSLPLEVAQQHGLLKAEVIENPVFSTECVQDSTTGECLSLDEASARNLVDLAKGVYIDPKTGEELPLQQAVKNGLAKAIPIHVESVVDPITGEELSLEEALVKGVIDIPKSIYLDPKLSCPLPLHKAIESDIVRVKTASLPTGSPENILDGSVEQEVSSDEANKEPSDVSCDESTENTPTEDAEPPLKNAVSPSLFASVQTIPESTTQQNELRLIPEHQEKDMSEAPDRAILEPAQPLIRPDKSLKENSQIHNPVYCVEAVLDKRTGQALPISDACDKGIVDPINGTYLYSELGEEIPLENIVDAHLARAVPYYIEWVVDPVSSEKLTLEEATTNGLIDIPKSLFLESRTVKPIPLSRAIERNLVVATEVRNPVLSPDSVYDATVDRYIDIVEAVDRGLVDLVDGVYKDPTTKENVPIKAAVDKEIIKCSPVYVSSVVDKVNDEEYTLAKAVEYGLVDILRGVYTSTDCGVIPLAEAADKGLIQTVPPHNPVYAITAALDTKSEEVVCVTDAVDDGVLDLARGEYVDLDTQKRCPFQKAVDDWFARATPIYIESVVEPTTGEKMNVEEAVEKGVVDLARGVYLDPKKIDPIPLVQADIANAIKSFPVKNTLSSERLVKNHVTGQEYTINEGEDIGIIEPGNDTYIDPTTKDRMPFAQANKIGLLSEIPVCIASVFDPKETEELTIEQAIDKTLIDPVHATFVNPVDGSVVAIDEAVEGGLVKTVTAKNPISVAESVKDSKTGEVYPISEAFIEALVDLTKGVYLDPKENRSIPLSACKDNGLVKFVPFVVVSVVDPETGDDISLAEAVDHGIVDLPKSIYNEPSLIEPIPLLTAIAENKVKAIPVCNPLHCIDGVLDQKSGDQIPIDVATERGVLDLVKGSVRLEDSGDAVPIGKAGELGYLSESPLHVASVIDPFTESAIPFEDAVMKGVIDLAKNAYVNPHKSEITPLMVAVEQGLVIATPLQNPVFCPEAVEDKSSGELISIEKAVSTNILNPQSGVYRDPSTGDMLTLKGAADQGLVKGTPLYINTVENTAASKRVPFENAVKDILDIKAASFKKTDDFSVLPLVEAYNKGYVDAIPAKNPVVVMIDFPHDVLDEKHSADQVDEPKRRTAITTPQESLETAESDEVATETYCIEAVVHPVTGNELSLAEAAQEHVINLPLNVYIDQKTDTRMSLKSAIDRGLVKATPLRNPVMVAELMPSKEQGELMTIARAVELEMVNLDTGLYASPYTGEEFRLSDGQKEGILIATPYVIDSVRDVSRNIDISLEEAVRANIVDITKSTFIDPETKRVIPLVTAIEQGLVKATPVSNPVSIIDTVVHMGSGEKLSMDEAILVELLDTENAVYNDPRNGQQLTLAEASNRDLVIYVPVNVEYVVEPETNEQLSLEDAVVRKILDLSRSVYLDPTTAETIPIATAIEKDLVKCTRVADNDLLKLGDRNMPTDKSKKRRRSRPNSFGKGDHGKLADKTDPTETPSEILPMLGSTKEKDAELQPESSQSDNTDIDNAVYSEELISADTADAQFSSPPAYEYDETISPLQAVKPQQTPFGDKRDTFPSDDAEITPNDGVLGEDDAQKPELSVPDRNQLAEKPVDGAQVLRSEDVDQVPEVVYPEKFSDLRNDFGVKIKPDINGHVTPPDSTKKTPGENYDVQNIETSTEPEADNPSHLADAWSPGNNNTVPLGSIHDEDINTVEPVEGVQLEHVGSSTPDRAQTDWTVDFVTASSSLLFNEPDDGISGLADNRLGNVLNEEDDLNGPEASKPGLPEIESSEGSPERDSLEGSPERDSLEDSPERDSLEDSPEREYIRVRPVDGSLEERSEGRPEVIDSSKPCPTEEIFDSQKTAGTFSEPLWRINNDTGEPIHPDHSETCLPRTRIAESDGVPSASKETSNLPEGILKVDTYDNISPKIFHGDGYANTSDTELGDETGDTLQTKDVDDECLKRPLDGAGEAQFIPQSDADSGIEFLSPSEDIGAGEGFSLGTSPSSITARTGEDRKDLLSKDLTVGAFIPKRDEYFPGDLGALETQDSILDDNSVVCDPVSSPGDMYRKPSDPRPVETFYKKLSNALKATPSGIKNPQGGKAMSFDEAVANGVVTLDPLEYRPNPRDVFSIQEAAAKGFVEKSVVAKMLPQYEAHGLEKVIEANRTSLEKWAKKSPNPLNLAVTENVINPENVFIVDHATHVIGSLSWMMSIDRCDPKTQEFIDPKTKKPLYVDEAVKKHIVSDEIVPQDVMASIETLQFLQGQLDVENKGVKHPIHGGTISLKDAVLEGVLDVPRFEYNPLGETPAEYLPAAVEIGHVDRETAKKISSVVANASLGAYIDRGLIIPNQGLCKHPSSAQPMPLAEAVNKSLLNPSAVFFRDNSTDRVVSLGSSIRDGKFELATATFRTPLEGDKPCTIERAIEKDLVDPYLDADELLQTRDTIQSLLDSKLVNLDTTMFRTPVQGIKPYPLHDALKNGVVNGNCYAKLDPDARELTVTVGDIVTGALEGISRSLEWVAKTEQTLAEKQVPEKTPEDLQQEISNHRQMMEKSVKEQEIIADRLKDARAVLDSERDRHKEIGEQEQYDTLHRKVLELRERNDDISAEYKMRLTRLYSLSQQLEDFNKVYQELQESIETQGEKFSDVRDEFLDTQMIPEVSEKLKQYENDLQHYRTKHDLVSSMPGKALLNGGSAIDDTIQHLAENHQHLMEMSRALDNAMTHYTDYLEKKKNLDPKLDIVRGGLEDLDSESDTEDPVILKQLVTNATELVENVEGLKEEQEHVTEAGEKTLEELRITRAPEEKEFVQNFTQGVKNGVKEYKELVDEANAKKFALNRAYIVAKDLQNSLKDLADWAQKCEAKLDNPEATSLDPEKLKHQLTDAEVTASEARCQKQAVDAARGHTTGSEPVKLKLADLDDKFERIIPKSNEAVENLTDASNKLDRVCELCEDLQRPLDDMMSKCTDKESPFDTNALRAMKDDLRPKLEELKAIANDLLNSANVQDKEVLLGVLTSIQELWHELDDKMASKTFGKAADLLEDYLSGLDQLDADLGQDDVISADPEQLKAAIKDNKIIAEQLEQKRKEINDLTDKCNHAFRVTTDDIQPDLRIKLDAAKSQLDHLCKICDDREATLEKTLPLAEHYGDTHDEILAWLDEIEHDVHSQCQQPLGQNPEHIKKQKEDAAQAQQRIDDQQPNVDHLLSTGHELMDLCCPDESVAIGDELDHIKERYDNIRNQLAQRIDELDSILHDVTSEVSEHIDDAVNTARALKEKVENLEPLNGKPESLFAQIEELKNVEAKLDKLEPFIEKCNQVKSDDTSDTGSVSDSDEFFEKIEELLKTYQDLKDAVEKRKGTIVGASPVATDFWETYRATDATLRELQENVTAIDSTSIDPEFIIEQQKELKVIEDDFVKTKDSVDHCHQIGDELCNICGPPAKMEVRKHLDDLDELCADIEDDIKDKDEELMGALMKARKLKDIMEELSSWLTSAEGRLGSMPPLALDARSIRIQIEELKVLKVQLPQKGMTLESLNQHAKELMKAAPTTVDRLQPQVDDVNRRWNNLLKRIGDREASLQSGLIKVGEVDAAMDDVIGILQEAEEKLEELENVYGDPRHVETHLKSLGHLRTDVQNQETTIRSLEKAVNELLSAGKEGPSKLKAKKDEMNHLLSGLYLAIKDKQNKLQDTLKEVKVFIGDVEDTTKWLADYKAELRHPGPMGAIPYSAMKHFDRFMEKFAEFEKKEDRVQLLLLNGEDMLSRCKPTDAALLEDNLKKLRQKWNSTKRRAVKKKQKLEGHVGYVRGFHGSLQAYVDWLVNAEQQLKTFKYPSKIVDRIRKQIRDQKEFVSEIESHRDILQDLDMTGTYLKYFGNKEDTLYVKTQLQGIKLRFKKLKRRAEERGRLLNQAQREDVRFYNSWKELIEWLENYHSRITGLGKSKNSSDIKHDVEEMRRFNHQLHGKYPSYHTTLRLGKNLKDRCTKQDPDRELLQSMTDELKRNWTQLRNVASQRQSHLDGVLLSSGQYSDALQSFVDWLNRVEDDLKETAPLLGDVDTLEILSDQHKAFMEELMGYEKTVLQMLRPSEPDDKLKEKLNLLDTKWRRVQDLAEKRNKRLQHAMSIAEEFNGCVDRLLDWLPGAEAELKFRPLPEEEGEIVQLIEKHEKFQHQVQNMEPFVETVEKLGKDILRQCHPSAKKFVKYHVTVIKTRWDQVKGRTKHRTQRLHDVLNSLQGNAAMVEELLDWITAEHADLSEKEKQPIPDDLATVAAMVKEHSEFHEVLTEKGKCVQALSRAPVKQKGKRGRTDGTHEEHTKKKAYETAQRHRVHTLNTKWRYLWRDSLERKKKLQDALEYQSELEGFKSFKFDAWRQRYLKWVHDKKYRLTDIFRQKADKKTGNLNKQQFIDFIMHSKFPTNRTELNAVFDIFDRDKSGEIDYAEFMEALKPDKFRKPKRLTESEMIQDEIEREVSKCHCESQLRVEKVADGKYRFGENKKLVLVRFLNSCVMVRVGGGWATLEKFLETHDPCRAKGRTNTELREKFLLPPGASQSRVAFSKKRGQTEASSTSSGSKPSSVRGSPTPSPSLGRKNRASSVTTSHSKFDQKRS